MRILYIVVLLSSVAALLVVLSVTSAVLTNNPPMTEEKNCSAPVGFTSSLAAGSDDGAKIAQLAPVILGFGLLAAVFTAYEKLIKSFYE